LLGRGGLDSSGGAQDTTSVIRPGASRKQIAQTLNAAYADGLLSADTFARRLDQLLDARLIDPFRLIGDLNLRRSRGRRMSIIDAVAAALPRVRTSRSRTDDFGASPLLLALDWSGGRSELTLGRDRECDLVLSNPGVSRRHARLVFRDGTWVLQDLDSTNGTTVNGVRVGRCELRPGDHVVLGDEHLQID
jgi:hypothetical protein